MPKFLTILLLPFLLFFSLSHSLSFSQSCIVIPNLDINDPNPDQTENSIILSKTKNNQEISLISSSNEKTDKKLTWDILPEVIDKDWMGQELKKVEKPTEKEKIFNIRWDMYNRYRK